MISRPSASFPPMSVEDLFADMPASILGKPSEEVTGIAYRSDAVEPGDAFFCIVGFTVDGHAFAQDAIDRGASVIVAERKLYLADATDVTVVVVPDSRRAMALCSCRFYGEPSDDFQLVGITGTNGKTTTTYLVEEIANQMGKKCGIIGTVGVKIDGKGESGERTTPESPDLQRTFATMAEAGCQVVAMEVSSHALDLERVAGSDFAVTAFTNLTQDHLDYHHTFEDYFEAKALLFSDQYPAKRVIGIDGKWGAELCRRCKESGDEVMTFGFSEEADIHPVNIKYEGSKTSVSLSVFGQQTEIEYPLVGRFNVENVMCAFGIGLSLGASTETLQSALRSNLKVPGRLERVGDEASDIYVFVDYAHTPDALEKAIVSVREVVDGRLICVFGCGGDRDSGKRPIMGKASLASDVSIVTSDNPRSEDPLQIIEDILTGMEDAPSSNRVEVGEDPLANINALKNATEGDSRSYMVIPDRRDAIKCAIALADPGDAVLIAGKGHEDYQMIGKDKIHFDDVEEAQIALGSRASEGAKE